MARVLLIALLLGAPFAAIAADDLRVTQLQQDIRDLQRQVQAQARQLDQLRSQLARSADTPRAPSSAPAAAPAPDNWLDAAKWQRLKPGMSELEVIGILGPPTSMRVNEGQRVLLYAMEIGSSGFLGGSVTLRDRVVAEVQKPALQ